MITGDISQFNQVDSRYGKNGETYLYTLDKIYSDNNKYIINNNNYTIYYYIHNSFKIVPIITDIIVKEYDLTEYLQNNNINDLGEYLDNNQIDLNIFLNSVNNLENYVQNELSLEDQQYLIGNYRYDFSEEYDIHDNKFIIIQCLAEAYIKYDGSFISLSDLNILDNQIDYIYDKEDNIFIYEETNNDIEISETLQPANPIIKTIATAEVDNNDKKPTAWNAKSDFSGSYDDLTDKPTLADLQDDNNHRTVSDLEKTIWNEKSDFNGSYENLMNKPDLSIYNKSIGLLSILISNPTYVLNSNDSLVQVWIDLIQNNIYTINDVPQLSNLKQLVQNGLT